MGSVTPHLLVEELVDALLARDVERVLALYDPDAVLSSTSMRFARGHVAIRSAMTRAFSKTRQPEFRSADVLADDDSAVAQIAWNSARVDSQGQEINDVVTSFLGMRCVGAGVWVIKLDRSAHFDGRLGDHDEPLPMPVRHD